MVGAFRVGVFRISVVVAVLLVAFATPAAAGPDVPIKGTVMGEHERVLDDPACPGFAWRFFSDGVGLMSHLGRAEYDLTQCTNPVNESSFESVGTVTFTAANGDTLLITHGMSSRFVFGPDPGPPLGFTMEGEWEAVGGTGRFRNATGNGSFEGVGDIADEVADLGLPDGLLQLNFKGKIAYDASDRSRK